MEIDTVEVGLLSPLDLVESVEPEGNMPTQVDPVHTCPIQTWDHLGRTQDILVQPANQTHS
jgi:hypothetical protein